MQQRMQQQQAFAQAALQHQQQQQMVMSPQQIIPTPGSQKQSKGIKLKNQAMARPNANKPQQPADELAAAAKPDERLAVTDVPPKEDVAALEAAPRNDKVAVQEIGRASCRERV